MKKTLAANSHRHRTSCLSHPLGPLPWALANQDGSLRKTEKAALMKKIGESIPPVETLPQNSACIIDGMSVVQKLNVKNSTFAEVSTSVLKVVLREGAMSQRIDVVFDVSKESSIKNAERLKRGSGSSIKFSSNAPGHKIKKWRNLSEADNKTQLIEFLVADWKTENKRSLIKDKVLPVTWRIR